jgi:hypothetical protein
MKKLIFRLGTLITGTVFGVILITALQTGNVFATCTPTGNYFTWIGTSTSNNWSVASNWLESAGIGSSDTYCPATVAPSGGNIVVLDGDPTAVYSAFTGTLDPTVNIDSSSGVSVAQIILTNSGSSTAPAFNITGYGLTLTNGDVPQVSGSSTGTIPSVTLANSELTFSGNQTIGTTINSGQGSFVITTGAPASGIPVINIPSGYTVSVASTLTFPNSTIDIQNLTGSGTLALVGVSGNVGSSQQFQLEDLGTSANTPFNGTIVIGPNIELTEMGTISLGSASYVINSGGTLELAVVVSSGTTSSTITIPNDLSIAGTGGNVSGDLQGAIIASASTSLTKSGTSSNLVIDLTGKDSLAANTSLASIYSSNVTYNFSNINLAGFSLTPVAASAPTYGTTTITYNGQSSPTSTQSSTTGTQSSTASTPQVPKAPDTGSSLTSSEAILPLLGALMLVFGLRIISKKTKLFNK